MKNRRLKMTLLELLDASPRLQKRLASMSLTSGKPIFHIDAKDELQMQDASSQILPSIFFIKNLLATDAKQIEKLKEKGQLISFVKIDPTVKKTFYKQQMTKVLDGIDCCVFFTNIAPLVNRLILGSLSQAMANISFSTEPKDFLYWGSWYDTWKETSANKLKDFIDDRSEALKINEHQRLELLALTHLGMNNFLRKNFKLSPREMTLGCDGTLLVARVHYTLNDVSPKYMLKLQRQIMKFDQQYLALDLSKISDNEISITKFIPIQEDNLGKDYSLLIVLNGDRNLEEIMITDNKIAG